MGMTHDATRRELLTKAAYVAPMVLTLQATSAVAKSGSEKGLPRPKKLKEAEQKVDRTVSHATPSSRCTSAILPSSGEDQIDARPVYLSTW